MPAAEPLPPNKLEYSRWAPAASSTEIKAEPWLKLLGLVVWLKAIPGSTAFAVVGKQPARELESHWSVEFPAI